jgi:hypothetical protein
MCWMAAAKPSTLLLASADWATAHWLRHTVAQASQDFDPSSRTVVNSADVFGKTVFVTADGTYQPQVHSFTPRLEA